MSACQNWVDGGRTHASGRSAGCSYFHVDRGIPRGGIVGHLCSRGKIGGSSVSSNWSGCLRVVWAFPLLSDHLRWFPDLIGRIGGSGFVPLIEDQRLKP